MALDMHIGLAKGKGVDVSVYIQICKAVVDKSVGGFV